MPVSYKYHLQTIVASRISNLRRIVYLRSISSIAPKPKTTTISPTPGRRNNRLAGSGNVKLTRLLSTLTVTRQFDASSRAASIHCSPDSNDIGGVLPSIAWNPLQALSHGVSEKRLAEVLNVSLYAIKQRRTMLEGVCDEAVEILRNNHVTAGAFAVLKKMKPIRQIEAAEHMHATNTYSVRFAKALLEVTRPEFLVETPSKRKPRVEASSIAAQAMIEQETDFLVRDLKAVEESYGTDMLKLSIGCGYVERVLSNSRVEKHLEKHHPDILGELRTLVAEVKPHKDRNIAA